MLSPDDAALVSRDPAVPGLPVLLDDAALCAWLGAEVRRRYLRYKPGTSCVLGASVAGQPIFVTAYADDGAAKLGKTLDKAPAGAILCSDRERLLLAGLPAADRDLPALTKLADPVSRGLLLSQLMPGLDLADAGLPTLAYKPQRRWVGLLTPAASEPVVLRAYRCTDAPGAVAATGELSSGPPCTPPVLTPAVLAFSSRWGLAAMQWLPGRCLDQALSDGTAGTVDLSVVGAALASLHGRRLTRLTRLRAHLVDHDIRAVRLAAKQIAALQPCLAERVRLLRDDLVTRLCADPGSLVSAHGDFSPDQVILSADGPVGFIDLDSAVAAEAALDLGSASAALHAAAILSVASPHSDPGDVASRIAALHDGYASMASVPAPERLAVHTAAALLRRAGDPFRLCVPDWPERVEALLTLAEAANRVPA